MKRWKFKLVLFLSLGTLLNVVVAWGLALGMPLYTLSGPSVQNSKTGDQVPFWVVEQLQSPGATRYVWSYVVFYSDDMLDSALPYSRYDSVNLDEIPQWSRLDYSKSAIEYHENWDFFIEDARGWPLLSMSSFTGMGFEISGNELSFETSEGVPVPDILRPKPLIDDIVVEWFNKPFIRFRPIWSGFVLNSFFTLRYCGH